MTSATTELDRVWDVLVVGAGPAGLFASLALAATSDQSVLLLDAGPDVAERQRALAGRLNGSSDREVYTRGIGGAGLFSDGKLCLSLDVGGGLREESPEPEKTRLLATVTSVFEALLEERALYPSRRDDGVSAMHRRTEQAGLRFKYYPVLHIGTDRCGDVIRGLSEALQRAGTRMLPHAEIGAIEDHGAGQPKEVHVFVSGVPRVLRAHNVVLGLGKIGAAMQQKICERLGVRCFSRPLYVGVRLETGADGLRSLFELSKDPKLSLEFADGSKFKTHCATDQGQVLALSYDGLPLAGGHNFHRKRSDRSGFALLWDGMRWDADPHDAARALMRRVAAFTNGELLVQTLSDYQRGIGSSPASLAGIPISNHACRAGNIRDFLPLEYFHRLDVFLDRLCRLVPDVFRQDTVLYAPAIEWWMKRIAVDNARFETSCPGLYVCGDGSGWSQGIVHSAATGLLVGQAIAGTVLHPSTASQFLLASRALSQPRLASRH